MVTDRAADEPTRRHDRRFTRFGRSELDVCRIGIGCGLGIDGDDLEWAIDQGVNLVFSSTDLHAVGYARSWPAIRNYCRSGSSRRERIVLAAASYVCDADKLGAVIADHLLAWELDHVDLFVWGWVGANDCARELLSATREALCSPMSNEHIRARFGIAAQVRDELHQRGYARYLGVSTHDRAVAAQLAGCDDLDMLMLRYNVAHRGAEHEVFPHLPAARPGIVGFNTLHDGAGLIASQTGASAAGASTAYEPTASDLYRFSLDRPEIDVVLAGPRNRTHIEQALRALDMPAHDAAMTRYLRDLGARHAQAENTP